MMKSIFYCATSMLMALPLVGFARQESDSLSHLKPTSSQLTSRISNIAHRISNVENSYWFEVQEEEGPLLNATHDASGEVEVAASNYRAHSLKFAWQLSPDHIYSSLYRMPLLGLGAYFGNFKNQDIGYPVALFAWFEIPVLERKNFSFGYTGGFGLAWDFNAYNAEMNADNVFISTTRNCYVDLSLYGSYRVNEHFAVGASVGLKHFSNGARRKPNYGINIVPVGLTAKFQLSDHSRNVGHRPLDLPSYIPYWRLNAKVAYGLKQNSIGSPTYTKGTVGISVMRQQSYKYRWGIGLEATLALGEDDRGSRRTGWREVVSPAATLCWEWVVVPPVAVPVELGAYLQQPKAGNGEQRWYYERVGVRAYLTQQLWLGLTIKAHAASADFFEWGLGFALHNNTNPRMLR
ncbi:MAG: hypothetical protein LBS94_04075 [Prevotellaceae bacterium]|jgi:hypothetical protein|nr:hypothetical protein [Prevotellaceae bacterium]